MNRYIFILFLCIFCIVISFRCREVKKKNKIWTETQKKIRDNRVLIKQYYYNVLVKEQEYKVIGKDSLVKDGLFIEYYQNGVPKARVYYKDGKPDSSMLTYHINGVISGQYFRLFGKSFGLQKTFNKNGILEKAFFKTSDTNTLFSIDYNEGEIESMKGIPMCTIYNNDTLSVNEGFNAINHVVVLDSLNTELELKLYNSLDTITDTLIKEYDYMMNSHFYAFSYKFKHKGIYTYQTVIKIFNQSGIKAIDTNEIIITVR